MTTPTLESFLERDRRLVMAGLMLLVAWAWFYIFREAKGLHCLTMCMNAKSGLGVLFMAMFEMWVIMMVAMMVPSAAPLLLMFARVQRQRRLNAQPFVPTGIFLLGYILIWTGFSALATILQIWFQIHGWLSRDMILTHPGFTGGILVGAGIFQWTSLKQACLKYCRTPLQFILTHWREGFAGAWQMGLIHGAYCLGCCWLLMIILFVVGVMNLSWVLGLTAFVILEKYLKFGRALSRFTGLGLVLWGLILIFQQTIRVS